ncbi:DUF1800 domain-containing protein [Pedobacter sp. MC2016-15]|uniref:DUF1800 domain-containing protein n=1 Tax=Pedobacter sp. MC2016-15 TaxID=2994473 RepID=UPI0022452CCA|nr:DUF1800 domain-containing protein [Pedobacter sp. MC2016-15]MCX2481649.1 DUF1800 domain-containing protein [Pedobacter sp. MC2016-15]
MMDSNDNFLHIKHLYNRAGFGISYPDLHQLSKKRRSKVVDALFKHRQETEELHLLSRDEFLSQQSLLASLGTKKEQTAEEKQQREDITKARNEKNRELNIRWIQQMMTTEDPFLEKMTLFWHGHFACRTNQPYYAQQLNNIQRTNALGSFKTLLIEVSKSPAMLDYLNNQQNRKGKPNENFSRELMELFTLGRGSYTENDIKQAARAFTGWAYNKSGDFEFNPRVHDDKEKTFFGQTGLFDGEAIIDLILAKPETATFICRKLYIFFVNDTPDENHVKELSDHFYKEKYDITAVMKKLFNADWFYEKANTGNKIKSPVELLVNMSREFYVTYNKPQVLIQLQTSLGQYLFNPPNVAGWAGGRNWIDSSSLMLRMKIPSLVLNDGLLDFNGKADPEDEAVIALNRRAKPKPVRSYVNAKADWEKFLASLPRDMKQTELATFLLQPVIGQKISTLVNTNQNLKNTAIAVTSMPEYQLC